MILLFFCMFQEQYQTSDYVSFSAELKEDINIRSMRLNENFIGLNLNLKYYYKSMLHFLFKKKQLFSATSTEKFRNNHQPICHDTISAWNVIRK